MMKLFRSLLIILSALILTSSCEKQGTELLVNQHCGSCHLVPEPHLLDKNTWRYGVMPEMGFRMGLKNSKYKLLIPSGDSAAVYGTLPTEPILTTQEWEAIKEYFYVHAPDSLELTERKIGNDLSMFEVKPVTILGNKMPFVTLVKTDTIRSKFLLEPTSPFYIN